MEMSMNEKKALYAYGKKPLTRKERANNVKKKDFFSKYSADAQAVLDILLDIMVVLFLG